MTRVPDTKGLATPGGGEEVHMTEKDVLREEEEKLVLATTRVCSKLKRMCQVRERKGEQEDAQS